MSSASDQDAGGRPTTGRLGVLAALGQVVGSLGVLLREIVDAGAERKVQTRRVGPRSKAAGAVEPGPPQIWLDYVAEHDPGWLRDRYPASGPAADVEGSLSEEEPSVRWRVGREARTRRLSEVGRLADEPPSSRTQRSPEEREDRGSALAPTPAEGDDREQAPRVRPARLMPVERVVQHHRDSAQKSPTRSIPTSAPVTAAPMIADPAAPFEELVEEQARTLSELGRPFSEHAEQQARTLSELVDEPARPLADPAPTFAAPVPSFAEPVPSFAEPVPALAALSRPFAEPVEARAGRRPQLTSDSTGVAHPGTRSPDARGPSLGELDAATPHSPPRAVRRRRAEIIEVTDRWPALPEPRPEVEDSPVESSSGVADIWRALELGQSDPTITQQRRK